MQIDIRQVTIIKKLLISTVSIIAALLLGISIGRDDYIKSQAPQTAPSSVPQITDADTVLSNSNDISAPQSITSSSVAPQNTADPFEQQEVSSQPDEAQGGFCIKEENGRLIVEKNGSQDSTPYLYIDINTDSLSEQDHELLQNGIYVSDSAELQQIIEDYTG